MLVGTMMLTLCQNTSSTQPSTLSGMGSDEQWEVSSKVCNACRNAMRLVESKCRYNVCLVPFVD